LSLIRRITRIARINAVINFVLKKAVVICHRLATEADGGMAYYTSSVIRGSKIFTAWCYRSAIPYHTFYQPAGNNPIALHP